MFGMGANSVANITPMQSQFYCARYMDPIIVKVKFPERKYSLVSDAGVYRRDARLCPKYPLPECPGTLIDQMERGDMISHRVHILAHLNTTFRSRDNSVLSALP